MLCIGGLGNGQSGTGAPGGVHYRKIPSYVSEDISIETRQESSGGKFFGVARAEITILERPPS